MSWWAVGTAAVQIGGSLLGGASQKAAGKTASNQILAEGRVNSLTTLINAEFDAFKVEQQAIATKMQQFLIQNNLDITERFEEFSRDSTQLNSRLAITQAETTAAIAEHNAILSDQDAQRVANETSADIVGVMKDQNREIANLTAQFGASGISLDSAVVQDLAFSVGTSFGNEINKMRYLAGVAQNRLMESAAQSRDEAERALLTGDIEAAQIRASGALELFNIQQGRIELKAQHFNSEMEEKDLNFMADLIRDRGASNAANVMAVSTARAAAAKATGSNQGAATAISGFGQGVTTLGSAFGGDE